MLTQYEKLTGDLVIAAFEAKKAVAKGEDGGTANLDTLTLEMPHAREEKVLAAIKAAGLHGRKQHWIGPRYFIQPPVGGQGNARTRQVEAMKKVMEEAGYSVLVYYQAD